MPSYNGLSMHSEDESSLEDTSNHDYISSNSGNNNNRGMFRETIGNSNGNPLAPIELKPDRKYFSFQGASQYQRAVGGGANNEAGVDSRQSRLETIPSPSRRPPASPAKEGPRLGTALPLSSSSAAAGMPPSERNQYQPMLRGQHGVTEICDTKDLDAIFKAPRSNNAPQGGFSVYYRCCRCCNAHGGRTSHAGGSSPVAAAVLTIERTSGTRP